MLILSVLKGLGYDCAECECVRDAFAHLQTEHEHNMLLVDICPISTNIEKYSQAIEVLPPRFSSFRKWRKYKAFENKYEQFVETLWLCSETLASVQVYSKRARKALPKDMILDDDGFLLNSINQVRQLTKFALRHEVDVEVCMYFSRLKLIAFPMGNCIALFSDNIDTNLISNIACTSGLFLRKSGK